MKRERKIGVVIALIIGIAALTPASVFAQISGTGPMWGRESMPDVFLTTTARDEWIQQVLREYPFYFIVTDMPKGDVTAATLAQVLDLVSLGELTGNISSNVQEIGYSPQDTSAQGFMMMSVIILRSPRGPRVPVIFFAKNRADADKFAANSARNNGGTIHGPFTHGSSARNARDSQERIINGMTSFIQYHNDKNPWN